MTLTRGTAAACIFAIVLAPATAQAGDLSIDGPIESTLGGFQFPDGTVQTTAASGYTRVVAVAKQGGDFTSIQSAIDSITDADPSNRYLVRVFPGVYFEGVVLKDHVDLAGSGIDTTTIDATALSTDTVNASAVARVSDMTLLSAETASAVRVNSKTPHLSRIRIEAAHKGVRAAGQSVRIDGSEIVVQSSSSTSCYGIDATIFSTIDVRSSEVTVNCSSAAVQTGINASVGTLTDVAVEVSGTGAGLNNGIALSSGASISAARVRVSVSGSTLSNEAVEVASATAQIADSSLRAEGVLAVGVDAGPGAVISITGSTVTGDFQSVDASISTDLVVVSSSLLSGPVGSADALTCVEVIDSSFQALDASCL